jgi:alkyldihydroxyacetonephosphate synthase
MLEVPTEETRPVLSLDMTRMAKVLSLDEANGIAVIECGANGREIEVALNAKGYTMGHEPDSYEFSTLGGWVSTAASGMKRSRYGNIEDMVLNCDLVTAPSGTIHRRLIARARSSHGPELQQLLFGSEGNFGVIVTASVKIHRLAERSNYGAYGV